MTAYTAGLHELGDGLFAYLQPDGSWGWSNAGLVTDTGAALLVDTLFDLRLTERMLSAMNRVMASRRFDALVNTHSNGDHWFGNQLVPTSRIIASSTCAEEMLGAPPALLAGVLEAATGGGLGPTGDFLQQIFGPFEFTGIQPRFPTETFQAELELRVGEREVRLIDLGPAHTGSDVVALVPAARTVFTGDILFIAAHPVMWAGPVENWIADLDRLLAMDVDTYVPGHGPITGRDGVAALRGYWEHLRTEVRARFEAGMTAEAAVRDLPLGDYTGWGEAERLAVNVDTIYRGLAGETERPGLAQHFAGMAALRSEAQRAP